MAGAEALGEIFRKKREDRGLSIEEAAERTYISSGVIRDMEAGAFGKVSPVYMKSFVKKYSDFLELDTEDVLARFRRISNDIPQKQFFVSEKEDVEKEKTGPLFPRIKGRERSQIILVSALSLILVLLVAVLGRVTVTALKSPPREVPVVAPSRSVVSRGSQDVIPREKLAAGRRKTAPPEVSPVTLTLTARDRVWVQVSSSETGKIFDGFLNKGDSRTWNSNEELTVWTGKANVLDFTVNGRVLGEIASGVVRNIKVSSEGVVLGDEWLVRFR